MSIAFKSWRQRRTSQQSLCGFGRRGAKLLAGLVSVISISAAAQEGMPTEQDLVGSPVNFSCIENGDEVSLQGYAIWFPPAGIMRPAAGAGDASPTGNAIRLSAAMVVKDAEGATRPVSLARNETGGFQYFVGCTQTADPAQPQFAPSLEIGAASAEAAQRIRTDLDERVRQATAAASLPLLLRGAAIDQAWFATTSFTPGATYGALLTDYLREFGQRMFVDRTVAIFSIEPEKTVRVEYSATTPGSAPVATAGSAKEPAAGTAPEPATGPGKGTAAAAGAPAGEAAPRADDGDAAITAPPAERPKRRILLSLGEGAPAGADLAAEGAIDTFGYCERATAEKGSTVALEGCSPGPDGKIPLRIWGSELIELDTKAKSSAPVQVGRMIRMPGFSVPYPYEWGNPAAERVAVPAGDALKLASQPIALRQWKLPGCELSVTPTIAELRDRRLNLPAPPCTAIDLVLPKGLVGTAKPQVTSGCRPGSTKPAEAAGGRVKCAIKRETQAGKPRRIQFAWGPGFQPVDLDISVSQPAAEAADVPADALAASLRPIIPASAAGIEAEPSYQIVEVKFVQGSNDCGAAVRVSPGAQLPTIADAGCKSLPDTAVFTLEIDRARTGPKVVLEAFEPRIAFPMPLLTAGPARFDIGKARRKLTVSFTPETQQTLEQQYADPADLTIRGVNIYADDRCTPKAGEQRVVELFKSDSRKAVHQWPIWARILDNEGQPLTNCAPAVIAKDAAAGPFLTFEFKSTRAAGNRRVVLIARSQDLMDKKGLPKALDQALEKLIAAAADAYRQSGVLSPVDVLTISQDGTINRAFSGELAALEQQTALSSIAKLDRTAPRTPDLSLLRLQPETKNADRIILIMDGSQATAKNVSELRVIASDLAARKGGGLTFVLSSPSCELWQPHSPTLQCLDISEANQSSREAQLSATFNGLLVLPPRVERKREPESDKKPATDKK